MKIGIVCASDDELAPFLPVIEHCKITERAMLKFYEGQIHGVDTVALFSGYARKCRHSSTNFDRYIWGQLNY